jgi:hypothetical protein
VTVRGSTTTIIIPRRKNYRKFMYEKDRKFARGDSMPIEAFRSVWEKRHIVFIRKWQDMGDYGIVRN